MDSYVGKDIMQIFKNEMASFEANSNYQRHPVRLSEVSAQLDVSLQYYDRLSKTKRLIRFGHYVHILCKAKIKGATHLATK
ncbi:hypothetical protein T08_3493 [Trichinella sp. T8]|nr:hypothetical protein T08_3493 [Trichinella sp. T8]